MNLPDGIQAEVGSIQNDGSVLLLARGQKCGKLNKGQLLNIPPYLVKRRNQHFHHLEHYGVDLIVGMNGFIWVGEHVVASDDMMAVDVIKKPEEREQEETHTTGDQAKHLQNSECCESTVIPGLHDHRGSDHRAG